MSNVDKFTEWVLDQIPNPVKKRATQKVNALKAKVNQIFNRIESLKSKEHEAAIKGYLKTYRIDGHAGVDQKTFIKNIKTNLVKLINKHKKSLKTKFIFSSKFHKTNLATGDVEEDYSGFHSNVEEIYAYNNVTELVNEMTELILEKVVNFQNQGSN